MPIAFNNTTAAFEYTDANGAVLASSANLSYLKQKVRNLGLSPDSTAAAPVASQVTALQPSVLPASEFSVDERFDFIERFTKGVARGSYLSLVLVGGPGLGKTHTVIDTLKQFGLAEILPLEVKPAVDGVTSPEELEALMLQPTRTQGDFVVIKGFSTPKAMYRALWENNGKIVVFDDADGAFKDPNAANILKGALDSSDPRYISWMTEKRGGDDDLPSRFEFTGRVIFISNLSIQQFPAAILSRAVHVDLTLTLEEKIERIEHVFTQMGMEPGMGDVLSLIKENAGKFKELSVRTAVMLLQIRKSEPDDKMFRRMSLYHAMT